MENRTQKLTVNSRKRTTSPRNEKEIYSINYEDAPVNHPLSTITSYIKLKDFEGFSKETVGLSLEVEIADSLKQLITSPVQNNSSLLDVTIVRPADLDCIRGREASRMSIKGHELHDLIASMERHKQYKKRLIDECRKNAQMQPIDELQETTTSSPQEPSYSAHKRKLKRRKNIEVASAPVKSTHPHSDARQPFISSAPISILKPLVGEIRQSLKHLEERIVEVGDHSNNPKNKGTAKLYLASNSSSDDELRKRNNNKLKVCEEQLKKTHHVYTTANTLNKLRTMLVCQNPDRTEDDDKHPCMCQHCGMVGLLLDSQKRPVIPDAPAPERRESSRPSRRESSKHRPGNDEQLQLIRDLAARLKVLEERVEAEEQRAVPKDYFKRVIRKLLNLQPSQHNMQSTCISKNNATQYSIESTNKCSHSKAKKKDSRMKYRNVQIQQGTGRRFFINPVLITKSHSESLNVSKSLTISEVLNLDDEKTFSEVIKKEKDKSKPLEFFWKWGEEIIKPGIDLKTKIITLFNDFQSSKENKIIEKKIEVGTEADVEVVNKVKNAEKEKPVSAKSSSKTLKKVLDLMSEKIYNDHVKPTVEAIKKEQNSFNKENSEQICNIKAAMDAALYKMNTKETQLSRKKNEGIQDYNSSKLWGKSGIPIRLNNNSLSNSNSTKPRFKQYSKSFIPVPKFAGTDNKTLIYKAEKLNYNKFKNAKEVGRYEKVDEREQKVIINNKNVKVTYLNPNAESWNEESSASFPPETSDENNKENSDNSSCSNKQEELKSSKDEKRRISKDYSVSDKLEFLKNIASTEVGKTQLWSNIWNQAKSYCKSKQDTVIIQVPTKMHRKQIGITEVEFTIEDIQKIVDDPKLIESIDKVPQEPKNPGNMESFLLIRSRKILEDVHKRLDNKFLKHDL